MTDTTTLVPRDPSLAQMVEQFRGHVRALSQLSQQFLVDLKDSVAAGDTEHAVAIHGAMSMLMAELVAQLKSKEE